MRQLAPTGAHMYTSGGAIVSDLCRELLLDVPKPTNEAHEFVKAQQQGKSAEELRQPLKRSLRAKLDSQRAVPPRLLPWGEPRLLPERPALPWPLAAPEGAERVGLWEERAALLRMAA